jgi:hypothetical protein
MFCLLGEEKKKREENNGWGAFIPVQKSRHTLLTMPHGFSWLLGAVKG